MPRAFQVIILTQPGVMDPSIAIAASRAGELGVLDLEYARDQRIALDAIKKLANAVTADFGVKLNGDMPDLLAQLIADLPDHLKTVILTSIQPHGLQEYVRVLHERKYTVLLEATCLEQAQIGERIGVDGLIAKGHEAGGRVSDETVLVLLQRFLAQLRLPVWAQGGIGLYTAAACAAAGAAGVILDVQLALTRESPLGEPIKARIARMDGSETICMGEQIRETYRVYFRPGSQAVEELRQVEARLVDDGRPQVEVLAEWRQAILKRAGWESPEQNVLLLGQDAAIAAPLAERFGTVGGVLQAVREAIQSHCKTACRLRPLDEGSPLARSHGTRYPILQGPMTRVSDVPEFAARVAEGGALPFLALALMRGLEVKTLLAETGSRLGTLPWGVGILGFVPAELRQEQLDAIREYRPPFALIAGGRPDQARLLEQEGITTYLHVPSPGLLKMFLEQGARRFVFEGRECGGHVGPRTSFVLWSQMIDVLLNAVNVDADPENYHIVFAGGIHDSLSAAMVAAMAAPLAERKVRVGVLLGSAYLFTEEAAASGAILKGFQEQALRCDRTVLLESGPGHSTRCVDTPYAATFQQEKRRLSRSGFSAEEIRLALEDLNLGRLRIASKGIERHPKFGQNPKAPKFARLHKAEQLAQGMYMIGQVAALRDKVCTLEALHHNVAVEGSNRLQAFADKPWQTPTLHRAESPSDIAIIGMACLLPKAPDLPTYWENILNKVDALTEVPKDRWDWELYFDPDPKAKDKIYSKWGGFLDDTPFDPMQYGMPPASLRSIEPAQLLTLEVVRAALKDAGYLERPFPRERTAVILGAGGGAADLGLGYGSRSFLPTLETLPEFRGRSQNVLDRLNGILPEWTEDSFAGILTNVAAGRVANRFNLGGTNCTVDAACASSLAALSLAVRELEGHTSDMVIVGGIDTMQNPFTYLCFSKTHALSPRGRCRTFDEGADGIAISEGIAIMVLKRLADAERDGDRIYAVIKGIGSSSDGKDKGLTAPRSEGQARALRRAYAKANVSPATVGLIEAHGTGTVAGDQAEVQALTHVFSEAQAQQQSCAIGSVKSMIGHTKCTAGAVGLIKASLALYHKVLPPTLGVQKPNPSARFPETPFFVNTELQPWIGSANGHPRHAGVSAFGFGGTNFHVVVEEYTRGVVSSHPAAYQQWPSELFLWKGDSRHSLLEAIEPRGKVLAQGAKPALCDLAYTVWQRVEERVSENGGPQLRLAVIATSLDDLKQKLVWAQQALANPETVRINDPRGIYFSEHPLAQEGKLAFLFPGQGSQYPNMLRDLAIQFPEVRSLFELGDQVLARQLAKPLSTFIFPPSSFSPEEERTQQQALTQTNIAQPAIGIASMATFHLLRALGIQPDLVAGHSYGEYMALAAAGVFSKEVLIALSEARGRFIVEAAGEEPGIMAAIEAGAEVVSESLKEIEGVHLANSNAPKQTVISGARAAVERAVEHLTAQGMTTRIIPVACAFHSSIVAPAQKRLAEFLSTVDLTEPRITVYSNTTAAPYPKDPSTVATRLVEHLVRPVEFVREIEAMYAAGARIFVEVGPRNILTNLVDQILGNRPKLVAASDQSGRSGLVQLLHLLGQLTVQGVAVKFDRLYQGRSVRRLDLNALEGEIDQKPVAPTVWLVNGARARPIKEALEQTARNVGKEVSLKPPQTNQEINQVNRAAPRAPTPVTAMPSSSPASPAFPGDGISQIMEQLHQTLVPTLPINGPALSASSGDEILQVMAQYQQMMTRFLDVQKSVMLSYLGGAPGTLSLDSLPKATIAPMQPAALDQSWSTLFTVTAPETPVPASEEPATQQPFMSHSKEVATPSPPAVTGPGKEELTSRLLAIVSERTGYPPEMLNLELDVEADLGIDSIKRVEILGNLQQSFAALRHTEGMMEKLAGVKTLRGIIDRVVEHLGAQPALEVSTPAVQPKASYAPAAGPGKEELTARLLAIVSERTGYPPEMLDLELDLEADLGIDSIKQVEILGNFQQSFAALGHTEGIMEKLAGVKTLRGIIDRVVEHLGTNRGSDQLKAVPSEGKPTSPSPDSTAASTPSEIDRPIQEDGQIQRFTLTAVEMPLKRTPQSLAKDRVVLITDDEQGVARILADELLGHGHKVALIRSGQGVQELGEGNYIADLSSLEAVVQLVALVHQRQGPLGGIVHLLSLGRGASFSEMDFESWRERLRLEAKGLFYLAKAASEDLRKAGQAGGACLLAATGMGGTFMHFSPPEGQQYFPGQGGIVGLVKTLAHEWPEVRLKAVDLNLREAAKTLADHLFEELTDGDDQVELGYDGSRRVVLAPRHTPLHPDGSSALTLDSSSIILITGGARGITAQVACRLAEQYHPTLLLVGRSPLPELEESPETAGMISPKEVKAVLMEQMRRQGQTVTPALVEKAYMRLSAERESRSNLTAMRRLGANVHYYQTDVRDQETFSRLVDQIYGSFGHLDGVIHGAGIIEDKLIQDKTSESFERVFDTKVDSAFLLSRKLHADTLKFIVFFSSVAGRFGNHGQGDYAAANEVLNKLALYLDREWPARVVSINWGPWEADGMVSSELRRQFAERGVELIPPAVGLRRLEEELNFGRKGEVEVIVGGVGWQQPQEHPQQSQRAWPLIARSVFSCINGTMELTRRLDPAYDLYLLAHQLDGQPVLPLAMAVELMAEMAAHCWPEMEVASIRNLRILHGIVLQDGAKVFRVLGKPEGSATGASLDIGVEIIGAEHPQRVHYCATVELVQRLPEPPPFKPLSLTKGRSLPMNITEIYRQWLFHGPLFQGITEIDQIGTNGIKAVLTMSSPQGWFTDVPQGYWLIDPLMLDSGLQLLILWAREHWDMTTLPSCFQAYRRFGTPLRSQRIDCELRMRPNTGGHAVHGDIFFLNSDGRVLGILEDIEGTCSKALNRLVGKDSPATSRTRSS